MAQQFYKIVDKNGCEMPGHYSGRNRTYEEAKKMVDKLNKNGEHRPYTMTGTQQTAVEWLVEQYANENYGIEVYEQAKQMEKEQIINAHTNAYLIGEDNISVEDANKASEQYYNQTYNQHQ